MAANAAFFYGILHSLVHERRPLWSRMSFEQADESFQQCARWGLEARVRWPKVGRVRVADLLRDQLIPQAMDGLRTLGADAEVTEHYGQILTERTGTGRNGARWQIDTVTSLELRGASRPEALAEMTRLYREGVDSGRAGARLARPREARRARPERRAPGALSAPGTTAPSSTCLRSTVSYDAERSYSSEMTHSSAPPDRRRRPHHDEDRSARIAVTVFPVLILARCRLRLLRARRRPDRSRRSRASSSASSCSRWD